MAELQNGNTCPKGHTSTDVEYCSECGSKMQAGAVQDSPSQPGTHVGTAECCPDCGIDREAPGARFCEVCGYNFVTGVRGEIAPLAAPEALRSADASAPVMAEAVSGAGQQSRWRLEFLQRPDQSPDGGAAVSAARAPLQLTEAAYLVGRHDEGRGITPEIDLAGDDAVSRRHALLTVDGAGGLSLRDIGAANGTRLNGAEVEPLVDYVLKAGDEITLGHWSGLRVHAADEPC